MFIWRLISSIVLLVIFLCAFLIKGHVGLTIFSIIGLILSVLCTYEFLKLMKNIGFNIFSVITESFAVLFFLSIIFEKTIFTTTDISLFILSLFAVYCWLKVLFSSFNKDVITGCAASSITLMTIIIPLNCLTLIYMTGYGSNYIGMKLALFLIIVTKSGDIGAYCIGTLSSKRSSGNHKIVPKISPKKSWEGTIGGLIVCIIITYTLYHILGLNICSSNFTVLIMGALLFIGGFIGDLSESVLKRITKIKDSGAVIPGIGGVLDLTDSLFINAPVFYILLKIFSIV